VTVLVAGAERVDAGKTTFSVGLVHRLGGVGFKPRAGNDYWFDHDDYLAAIGDGRLYGKDARRLAEASADPVTPEAINPVHRLWQPVPDTGRLLGQSGREFVLDRVGESFVVNATADVPGSARDALPVDDATTVRTVEELNAVTRERHLPELDALRERIAATDPAVVESYGDVARPLRDLTVERVVVVEPGRVRIYDGARYEKACRVATGDPGTGALEERVPDVVEPIEPVATVDLPALDAETRATPAAVASAYADAYDALLG